MARSLASKPAYPPRAPPGSYPAPYSSAPYSTSYSAPYSNPYSSSGPKVSDRDTDGRLSISYPCGCTVRTRATDPPKICPFCNPNAGGSAYSSDRRASEVYAPRSPAPYQQTDPFGDSAEMARNIVDRQGPANSGPNLPLKSNYKYKPSSGVDPSPRNIHPLANTDDERASPNPTEIALPESPTAERGSTGSSAILVDEGEGPRGRSDTLLSAPPAYDETEADWTPIEVPSGRSSPSKDYLSSGSTSKKKKKVAPVLPPRPGGLSNTMTSGSFRPPGVFSHFKKGSPSAPSTYNDVAGAEPSIVTTRPLGRPQNSSSTALSPSGEAPSSSFPNFPSAPRTDPGASQTPNDTSGRRALVLSDPRTRTGNRDPLVDNQDPLPIKYKGEEYPSAEHLFHAMRFMDTRPLLADHIRECDDPKEEAERFAYEQNPGWDQMRLQKMEEVIQLKCKQHSSFKDKLRDSGDTPIVFNDPDPFWGTGPDGKGENKFGEVLMSVRAGLGKGRLFRRP